MYVRVQITNYIVSYSLFFIDETPCTPRYVDNDMVTFQKATTVIKNEDVLEAYSRASVLEPYSRAAGSTPPTPEVIESSFLEP